MNTTTIMLVFLMMIVVIGMWQSRKMKTMVLCKYTSRSKQTFDKLVSEKNGYVIFEGKKFRLLPSCGSQKYYDKGFSGFFPTKITAYDFRWNSDLPIDPNTGEPAMLTPENMAKLNQEGALGAYAGSQDQFLKGGKAKLGGIDKWMPFIVIGLGVAIGYAIYMQMQMKADQDIIKQAISDIFTKIGIK
jgi:hypothetical protein